MVRMTPSEQAEVAADRLRGTAQSMADLGEEFEDLANDKVFCERLDELVFICNVCDWWCDISELSDNGDGELVCDECHSSD